METKKHIEDSSTGETVYEKLQKLIPGCKYVYIDEDDSEVI